MSTLRGGDDESGNIVAGGVREGDDWDDPCELIVGSVVNVGELYIYI